MSSIGKASVGFKKVDTLVDKYLAQGFKVLMFAHKWTSSGQTELNLSSLNPPTEMTSDGFVNPSYNDLLSANIGINRQNVRLISSLNGPLVDYLSYDVISNSLIRFKSGAQSTASEIIIGYITPVNMTGLLAVQGSAIGQTGTLAVGQTDIIVNQPFVYNNYSSQQVGDVLVYLDGQLQMRNIGNSASGDGNYYEIAPSSGNLSNTIRFNAAPVGTAKSFVIVSNGLAVQAPTSQGLAKIDSIASQIDAIVQDLATATGNSTSKYQPSGPNSVDLSMFGTLVKSFISGIHYDAVVGSSAQLAAGQCTYTSVQAAINSVASGSRILILQGTYNENITLSQKIFLEGKGNGSFVNGTLTVQSGASLSIVKWIRWGDNITLNSSANSIFIRECWQVTGKTIINNGTGNSILVATE